MSDNVGGSPWNINNVQTSGGGTGPTGPAGPTGPPGPGSLPMTPTVEGIAFGETSVGRTLLGFGVDDGSNNVGLWCSSVGLPQGACNASSAVTAFMDTDTTGALLLNSVAIGENGSLAGTDASNSILIERSSTLAGVSALDQNTLIANNLVLDPSDAITRSVALIGGSFVTNPSTFDQSILIGDVTRTGGLANDVILLRTQGGGGTLTMANNSAYIGNGANTYVSAPGDCRVADYQAFFLNTLRPDATPPDVVFYDPAGGELTYGALPAAPVDMTPTVSGLAFGSQDPAKELNSFGAGVSIDPSVNRATARYNAASAGTPQAALYSSAIFDDNRSTQTAGTSTSDAITTVNGGDISDSQYVNTITTTNNANTSVTSVGDSIFEANLGSIKSAQVLNSIVVANNSTLDSSTFDRACMHVSGLTAPGIGFEGSTMLGSLTAANVTSARESMFLASNAGTAVNQAGRQSLYIGNCSFSETITDREARISGYDRFFLRALRNDVSSNQLAYYDPNTTELTFGSPPALAVKQPTTSGGQFGINSLANNSEVNGRNSFNNYAAGPTALSGVTAVGQQLYQASVPGTNNFTNCIFLGRSHQFTGANLIQNSMIAATITGNVGITGISESCMIVPRAASLLLNYSGACTGANFHSSGVVTCTSDPLFSTVLSSGGTVNPGTANLVVCENQSGGLITMSGQGNTLISSSSAAQTYSWPGGVSNSTVIRSGANPITPNAASQLAVNHTSFLFPNLSTGTVTNAVYPVTFNLGTGLISHVISADLSRVLRRVGTTNAAGQIVFSTGTITPLADSAISLTVRNTSTTVSYNAQVIAIGLSSVTVQVFNSVTVVLASPSMTPSGAGIIVHMNMSY